MFELYGGCAASVQSRGGDGPVARGAYHRFVDTGRALSHLLLACTIELDNAFEVRWSAAPRRPWSVSWAMWANFLRYVPDAGMAPGTLAGPVDRGGLLRWGYLEGDADRVGLTEAGRRSRTIWAGLAAEVEERWRERLGAAAYDELVAALLAFGEPGLPRYLPVVRYSDGLRTPPELPSPPVDEPPDLPMLLAQPLQRWTLDYEREAELSLPVAVDVLRVLHRDGVRVADLPRRSGVSKEGLTAATRFLERQLLVVTVPDPARSRGKLVRLTDGGDRARHRHLARVDQLHERWRAERGADRLDAALAAVLARPEVLAAAIEPPEQCWRARPPYRAQTSRLVADPLAALPHHPMVLHRGGFPDGA